MLKSKKTLYPRIKLISAICCSGTFTGISFTLSVSAIISIFSVSAFPNPKSEIVCETVLSLKECTHGKVELAAAFVVFGFRIKVKAHLKSQGTKGGLPANTKARTLSHI